MRTMNRILLALAMLAGAAGAPAQVSPWSSGTFVYDGAGNIMRIGADYYVYDQAGRLIQGSADNERSGINSFQLYTYDIYGNRNGAATFGSGCIGGCGAFLDINEYNHIRTTSHGASYDGGGNLTQYDGYQYTYDAAQMMTRIRLPNTTLDNQYVYTADDERLATYIAPGQWRFTVRDLDGKVLREVTASEGSPALWSWDRDHVFRDGRLLATVFPSNLTQHYHLDHLGTPRLVTGNTGTKLGIHAYYAFGEELSLGLGEGAAERLQYTGHERDLNGPYSSALDYMHARYNSPAQGRFLSIDPVFDQDHVLKQPQRWNRYTYGANNPLSYIDPTGEIIFLGALTPQERVELLKSLNEFTGNTYGVDANDNLVLVSYGQGASATASQFLQGAIEAQDVYRVKASNGDSSVLFANSNIPTGEVTIDFRDFAHIDYGSFDPRTFSLGSNLIHELIHVHNGIEDPPSDMQGKITGPVVDYVNKMRAERGFPLRGHMYQGNSWPTVRGHGINVEIPFIIQRRNRFMQSLAGDQGAIRATVY